MNSAVLVLIAATVAVQFIDVHGENCADTNKGLTNKDGEGCDAYIRFPSTCGYFDGNEGFVANQMCCACGGGKEIGDYKKTSVGSLCADKAFELTEKECKTAVTVLGLQWAGSWNGHNDFPACLYADDGRNKVFFNRSPNPSRTNVNQKYSAICKAKVPEYTCVEGYCDQSTIYGKNIRGHSGYHTYATVAEACRQDPNCKSFMNVRGSHPPKFQLCSSYVPAKGSGRSRRYTGGSYSGYQQNKFCTVPCTTSSDCHSEEICISGRCKLQGGKTFTQKYFTTCESKKYKKFTSLHAAKIECGKDSGCYGVYDNYCDGGRWFLCPYGSTYQSRRACVYVKDEVCEDDPNWSDNKYDDGSYGCADMTTDFCQNRGDYSTEARRGCPKTCGVCSSESTGSCTTKGGHGECVFPFKFEGREHNSCITSGGYAHWCAYSVDSNGVMTNWAYCNDNCKDTVYAPPVVCPTGYLAIDGDVAGGGLTGGYSASLEKCKDDCEARSDCNSFVHSTNDNSCKLMEEAAPTHPKWKDGQFCKKDQLAAPPLSPYVKTPVGTMCNNENGDYEIKSEKECREAGKLLGLAWAASWNGPNDFPACLYADDARKKVYFNRSLNPGRTKAYPTYSAICTKKSA